MNRAEAKRQARQGITLGEARALVASAGTPALQGMSRVNPAFTKLQVFDILFAGYEDEPDTYMIRGLPAQNILREFA